MLCPGTFWLESRAATVAKHSTSGLHPARNAGPIIMAVCQCMPIADEPCLFGDDGPVARSTVELAIHGPLISASLLLLPHSLDALLHHWHGVHELHVGKHPSISRPIKRRRTALRDAL